MCLQAYWQQTTCETKCLTGLKAVSIRCVCRPIGSKPRVSQVSLSLSLSLVISDSSQYFIIILHHSTLSIHQAMEKHYFLTVMEIVGMVHEVASQDKDSWLWLLKKNFNDRRWGLRYD